jgi:hypothetical protein
VVQDLIPLLLHQQQIKLKLIVGAEVPLVLVGRGPPAAAAVVDT